MAFAFFLCVIQGSGPAFDLAVARDRVIGIIIGNLVTYFVFVHLWPVSIGRRVDPSLATVFRQLAQLISTAPPRERRLLASQAQGTLREIETDIELAHYEPPSIRRSTSWLSARRHMVEESQSLGTLLLLSADTRELARVDAPARLERLALRLAGPFDTVTSPVTESAHGWQSVTARVHRRLQALEETLAPGAAHTVATPHAHA
jgi:multidrug resistance protein MdtO